MVQEGLEYLDICTSTFNSCVPYVHVTILPWTGLGLHPDSVELQTGLKEARVAVLNELLEESEEEEEGSEGEEHSCTDETYLKTLPEAG